MPVQSIEDWAVSKQHNFPLSFLKDTALGIDATYYLELRINRSSHEPLLHALSGIPYSLKEIVDSDLRLLRKHDIKPIFVFDGLAYKAGDDPLINSKDQINRQAHNAGWAHYIGGDADKTLQDFTRASYPVSKLFRFLQNLLHDHEIEFMVAPYSASAQLAYLYNQSPPFLDAILGSSELFLFGVDKIILDLNQNTLHYNWLSRTECNDKLGENIPVDLFRDCQLLLGNSFLPTFPPLEQNNRSKANLRDVFDVYLKPFGGSVLQALSRYEGNNAAVQQMQYGDRYKKAILSIKHHVVLETSGKVTPMNLDRAPGDIHEFIGQRLPEELHFYISKGMIGPEVPNWLASAEIRLQLPPGLLPSETYRRLLATQLEPIRVNSLSLLSGSLHRYYQTREVSVWIWDDGAPVNTIRLRDVPFAKDKLSSWRISECKFPKSAKDSDQGFLSAALTAAKDDSFMSTTTGESKSALLKSKTEITFNVMWRFLQLRGYLNDKHQLSSWGKILASTFESSDPADKAYESLFLAIEMTRLGLVHGSELNAPDGARQTVDEARYMTNLISRIACFGRLKHKPVGYSGPLDRPLLAYAHMIAAVRNSLRNLLETILIGMLLGGEIDRNRSDWTDLSLSLPFINDNGSGLGIATQTYLDGVNKLDEKPPSTEAKEKIRTQSDQYSWFQFVPNLSKNLDKAFRLWDAVFAGLSAAPPSEFKEAATFKAADEWLAPRR